MAASGGASVKPGRPIHLRIERGYDMRPNEPQDKEQRPSARGGGLASRYSLTVVCALSLLAGCIAALALHHATQGTPEVQDVARTSTEAGREAETRAETVERGMSAVILADDAETSAAGVRPGDSTKNGAGASPVRVRKAQAGSGGAEEKGRADRRPRVARSYVRASREGTASGGRGVAGHTVRGVKKTGEVIGKTFGKIGGVFHD